MDLTGEKLLLEYLEFRCKAYNNINECVSNGVNKALTAEAHVSWFQAGINVILAPELTGNADLSAL